MMRSLVWALPLCIWGCAAPVAEPPDPAEQEQAQAPADDAPPVRCAYELQAPHDASGALTGYFGAGVDCVPPEGGDQFTFGFALDGDQLKLTAARPVTGTPALYGNIDRTACVSWTGRIDIVDDQQWSVVIDATCQDDPRIAVRGRWSGVR
jgi:hypothetical protein